MNKILPTIATVISIIAIVISIIAMNKNPLKLDFGEVSPEQAIITLFKNSGSFNASQADIMHNLPEILKTFEVVDVRKSGNHALALYRYSVGSKIIRDYKWTTKISGQWYLNYDLNYSCPKDMDKTLHKELTKKSSEWSKND